MVQQFLFPFTEFVICISSKNHGYIFQKGFAAPLAHPDPNSPFFLDFPTILFHFIKIFLLPLGFLFTFAKKFQIRSF